MSSNFMTSISTANTSAPSALSCSSALFKSFPSMSAIIILIALLAHSLATAKPIPFAPPVITATLPLKSFII